MGKHDDLGPSPIPTHQQRRRESDRDPMARVAKEDLWHLQETLTDLLESGFKGVYARQDKTNGRVLECERVGTEATTKIKNLERQVFRQNIPRSPSSPTVPEEKDRRITERDVRMFVAGAGGLTAIVAFFWKVLPFMLKGLSAGITP